MVYSPKLIDGTGKYVLTNSNFFSNGLLFANLCDKRDAKKLRTREELAVVQSFSVN